MKRNESSSSLTNFIHYDFLQQKLKGLEEENRKLRLEVCTNFEIKEIFLFVVCLFIHLFENK